MGFTTGFTGGVAVTLSAAYLTVLAHQRNREQQGAALRAQALAISSLIDPLPAPLPPTRSEVAAAQRATSVEVAKDRWNTEIEHAVRWVQNTDWEEVREGLEEGASRLWTKAFGETPEEVAVDAKEQAEAAAIKAKGAASGVAASARDAYSKAKASGISAEQAAENKVLEARLWTKKETVKAGDAAKGKAEEAKGLLATAWETGKDKAKNLAGLAKGAADAAESATNETLAPALSPVQRALQQRYQRPEAKVNKTVAEVLKERYTPLDQRDNTVLRGV